MMGGRDPYQSAHKKNILGKCISSCDYVGLFSVS